MWQRVMWCGMMRYLCGAMIWCFVMWQCTIYYVTCDTMQQIVNPVTTLLHPLHRHSPTPTPRNPNPSSSLANPMDGPQFSHCWHSLADSRILNRAPLSTHTLPRCALTDSRILNCAPSQHTPDHSANQRPTILYVVQKIGTRTAEVSLWTLYNSNGGCVQVVLARRWTSWRGHWKSRPRTMFSLAERSRGITRDRERSESFGGKTCFVVEAKQYFVLFHSWINSFILRPLDTWWCSHLRFSLKTSVGQSVLMWRWSEVLDQYTRECRVKSNCICTCQVFLIFPI